MNSMRPLTIAVLSTLAVCIGLDTANGQVLRRRVVVTQPQQMDQPAQGSQTGALDDTFLASWIGADNQCEISLNEFASQRLSNQAVKDFSQEMIRAHTDLANKLNQALANSKATASSRMGQTPYIAGYRGTERTAPAPATPATGNQGTTPATQPAENAPGNTMPGKMPPAATQGAAGSQQAGAAINAGGQATFNASESSRNAVNFKQEISNQMVKTIEEKLGQKNGADFDRCFVQGQIGAHLHMLSTLEVARNQASPQLKPVLDEAIAVTQKHLSHAESLVSKLEPQKSP